VAKRDSNVRELGLELGITRVTLNRYVGPNA
jgi:hypothetical protein